MLTCRPDSICWRWRSISPVSKAGCRAMSDSIRIPVSKLSFITTMLTKVRSVRGAGAHRAADEVDGVVQLSPIAPTSASLDALVEQRRRQVREPELLLADRTAAPARTSRRIAHRPAARDA